MSNNAEILSAKEVTVCFGGLVAVDHVDLHLNRGEIIGLIGANGAGKTTLFNAITGFVQLTSGSITIDGKTYTKPVPHTMCKNGIGRTYQVCQPFGRQTALQNVMVGAFLHHPRFYEARNLAEEILERLDLEKYRDTMGKDMSLIQLKRLELARALATEPKVLLLDEVMAGLNNAECEEVMDIIRGIREQGISIVVVEHVMKAVMGLSERIYVLNQGHLIAEGTPAEVSQNPDVIKSYLGESKHVRH